MQKDRCKERVSPLSFPQQIHALHRFHRYKRRTEKDGLTFLLKQQFPAGAAIDIGANRGIYSYFLSRHAASFEAVFAFEPQPSLFPYLLSLKETFALQNLSIIQKGLSSSEGTMDIFFDQPGNGGAGYDLQKNARAPQSGEPLSTRFLKILEHLFSSSSATLKSMKTKFSVAE